MRHQQANEVSAALARTTMNLLGVILLVVVVTGCSSKPAARQVGKGLKLTDDRKSGSLSEMSLWSTNSSGGQLVARFVVDTDKVVSVLPTPVSSDANRPIGEFIHFGNGWTPVFQLYLDERNKLYQSDKGTTEVDENGAILKPAEFDRRSELPPDSKDRILPRLSGPVYIVVQQGASFTRVVELLTVLGNNEQVVVGIGWDRSWF